MTKPIKKIISIIFLFIALGVLVWVFIIPLFYQITLYLDSLTQVSPTITSSPANNEPIPSITTIISSPIPTKIIKMISSTPVPSQNIGDTSPWGIAQQVDEHTWTMKIGEDSTMATSIEILDALNNYRISHGSQKLTIDSKLNEYAQSRAEYFYQNKSLDGHKGFNTFLENEDGFNKLGFTWLGENASYGYQLNGVHLIEWIYAGDEDHNQNQLNNNWNYVGIGVKGTATCLIFATGKI